MGVEFIGFDFIENLNVCDELIDLYNQSKKKSLKLENVKNLSLTSLKADCEELATYNKELQKLVTKYIDKFPFCNWYAPWTIVEDINIQHYAPGESYYGWHTERANSILPWSNRHLVFMTYLNTLTDGGETEFYHQKFKVKPTKGLTLIWPADWTHTHRGNFSLTQSKYIITGWFSYVKGDTNEL